MGKPRTEHFEDIKVAFQPTAAPITNGLPLQKMNGGEELSCLLGEGNRLSPSCIEMNIGTDPITVPYPVASQDNLVSYRSLCTL